MTTVIKEKPKIQDKINSNIRLDMSYVNYKRIIDKKLPYKFSYLDEWLLKKSKLLANESNILEHNLQIKNEEYAITPKYKTYGRGTLIKVDFGIGLGSEMSQVHFAIVMNNFDNPKSGNLTVVPLSSKGSKFYVNLGDLIEDLFITDIKKEIERLKQKDILNIEETIALQKLDTLLEYYKSYMKNTYACPSSITTISKERIFKPVNEFDMMGKIKCPKDKMQEIDNAIMDRFFTLEIVDDKEY